MAARSGMTTLIKRVRLECNIGTADYSVNGVNHYTDDHVQERLDDHRIDIYRCPLRGVPEYAAGSTIYQAYHAPHRNLEEAASGSDYWRVDDSDGNEIGTADYTVDYQDGLIRFNEDTGGSIYYLTARAYNINRTAAQIWRQKAGFVADGYDFAADNQRFNRSQRSRQYMQMAADYDRRDGVRTAKLMRADLL